MPYSNIVFVKLFWRDLLHNDDRFLDQLDDSQKGLYLLLLLLAGATQNNIKNDENYIKRTLNLSENPQKIRMNLEKIRSVFPKLMTVNGYLKFKNFKKFHNYLGKSEGTPKDKLGSEQNKNRIRIEEEYIKRKKYPVYFPDGSKDKELEQHLFRRNARTAKELIIISNNKPDSVIKCMNWFGDICDKKGLSWTLETILKWYPEFLSKQSEIEKLDDIPEYMRSYFKKEK